MKVVSVINYKGGVGKTTIVANLAAELAFNGKRVLAVDLDPQANLTFSFVSVDEWVKKYREHKTIKNWYDAYLDEDSELDLSNLIIQPTKVNKRFSKGKIDLICSHLALINVDLELATRLGGATSRQARNNFLRVYSRLKQGLDSLPKDSYDIIIIDCPPTFNIVTRNALIVSDYYLIPAKADYLSTLGIDELRRHVDELVRDYNKYAGKAGPRKWNKVKPKLIGVLFTMVSYYANRVISAQRHFIAQVERLEVPILESKIRENKTIFADAPEYLIPVVVQHFTGYTYTRIQRELEDLTKEFISKIK